MEWKLGIYGHMVIWSYGSQYLFITSVNKHSCFTNTDGTLIYFYYGGKTPLKYERGGNPNDDWCSSSKFISCKASCWLKVSELATKESWIRHKTVPGCCSFLNGGACKRKSWSCFGQVSTYFEAFEVCTKRQGLNVGLNIPLVSTSQIFWFKVYLKIAEPNQTIKSEHVLYDISDQRTQINVLFAALKLCCQAKPKF